MAHRLPLADIQFIAEFAAFARGKGDEEYSPTSPLNCAVAQFGFPSLHGYYYQEGIETPVPEAAFQAAVYANNCNGPFTFSALADRLEALICDAPIVERAL